MTTDADSRVAADWAWENLTALDAGADLVCGRIFGDQAEAAAFPASMHEPGALEAEYKALAIELDARLDPRSHDPWPHHGEAAGASLAIRAADYLTLGRLPTPPVAEDRVFAALADGSGLRVRHCDAARVTVSCRAKGRATGGMADAIAARIADSDSPVDDKLMTADATARTALWRRRLRTLWEAGRDPRPALGELAVDHPAPDAFPSFHALWTWAQASAPALRSPRLRPSDLRQELPALRRLVEMARCDATP
jgi:hypothetical protein